MVDGTSPVGGFGHIDERIVADTALVVEALAALAGPPDALETQRERRAWELISNLATDLGMTPAELLHVTAYAGPQRS